MVKIVSVIQLYILHNRHNNVHCAQYTLCDILSQNKPFFFWEFSIQIILTATISTPTVVIWFTLPEIGHYRLSVPFIHNRYLKSFTSTYRWRDRLRTCRWRNDDVGRQKKNVFKNHRACLSWHILFLTLIESPEKTVLKANNNNNNI